MSPLPDRLVDRWEHRAEAPSGGGMVYWHVLLGNHPQVQELAREAQERLSGFAGLHMTPLQWVHITARPGTSLGLASCRNRPSSGRSQRRRDLTSRMSATQAPESAAARPRRRIWQMVPGAQLIVDPITIGWPLLWKKMPG